MLSIYHNTNWCCPTVVCATARYSIHSYDQLSAEFLNHFTSACKQKRTAMCLFTTALLEIPITSEDVLISAFTQGLRGGKFFDNLSLNPPSMFHGLLRLAKIYINLEDAKRLKKDERAPGLIGRKPGKRDEQRGSDTHRSRLGRGPGGVRTQI